MIQKIDHLGIAVKSLDEAVPYYEKALGLKCEHREEVASQKVRTAFFRCGEVHIELLEPTSPESPIAKFLEKNPAGGIHHVAFGTDNITAQLAQAAGVDIISFWPTHNPFYGFSYRYALGRLNHIGVGNWKGRELDLRKTRTA